MQIIRLCKVYDHWRKLNDHSRKVHDFSRKVYDHSLKICDLSMKFYDPQRFRFLSSFDRIPIAFINLYFSFGACCVVEILNLFSKSVKQLQ